MAMLRSAGLTPLMGRPLMKISPEVISSSPATMLSSVDLPQPEGPTSTRNSPSSTEMLVSWSTCTEPKDLVTFSMSRKPMAATP